MARFTRNSKLKIASLFCGCGGMDLGLHGDFSYLDTFYKKLPFETIYAVDNDSYASKIYNSNFSTKCETKDVREIKSQDIPDHDILIGGFPCQSFSIIAQNPPRLGTKDDRGQLFFEICRILKDKRPRFFVAENVKGLLSANKKKAFPLILKEFESCGYQIKYTVLNSSCFGVPQKRERVFIVGFREFEDFFEFSFPQEVTKNNPIPLKRVLDKHVDEKYFFSDKAVQGMLRVRAKMNKGRAQNIEEPCNTINSHLSKVSLNSTDPVLFENNRYRRFTPREAARIQSFPENFILDSVSENRQYRAIGNAVPPVLMWNIAKELVRISKIYSNEQIKQLEQIQA